MKPVVWTILLAALSASGNAQWLKHTAPGIPRTPDGKPNLTAPAPRTPDGQPDISGLWNKLSPKYGANVTADLKSEDIPAWVQTLVQQRRENLGKDYMTALCLPIGPGYSTNEEFVRIVQTPSLILILHEDLTFRQVFMDGRKLEDNPNPSWMGYSVGHWDGDTLVVESNGFNDRTWLDTAGHPHTEALRLTERYHRRDFGHLELKVTLEDPKVYSKPWTVALEALLAPDTELIQAVCAENNKGLEHWVGTAADDRKNEVKVAPEVLAQYVGTYVEQPKLWRTVPRVITITASGSTLYGDIGGRGGIPLSAQSQTEFLGLQWALEFAKNSQGETDLLVKQVSGIYRFARKK